MNIVANYYTFFLAIAIWVMGFNCALAEPLTSSNELTLASFQLEAEADRIILSWKFEEAVGKVRIFVERAGMDMKFSVVGEGEHVEKPRFVDHEPQAGISFYRLLTQYEDGSIAYHPTISVSR